MEGFWNAQSVTLGGLGRVPNQKEAETMKTVEEEAQEKLSPEMAFQSQPEKPVAHRLTLALLDGKEKMVCGK